MTPATLQEARAAKKKITELLSDCAGVRGIGIATIGDGYGVKVNFENAPPSGAVPDDVDGVPVIVDVVGPVELL